VSEVSVELGRLLRKYAPDRPTETFFGRDHTTFWSELRTQGWLAIGVPQSEGGAGADLIDLLEIAAVWGRYLVPVPFVPSMLVHRWLPEARISKYSALTFAVRGPSGRVFAPFGKWPTIGCCFASGKPRDFVDGGLADEHSPSLPLVACVEDSCLPEQWLQEVRSLAAAEAVGAAAAVMEQTITYAKQRSAYGQPIVLFQAIRHLLADMHCELELARSAVVWSAQPECDLNTTAVKLCLGFCRMVLKRSLQVHGGIAFTWDLGLHYYLRHILALEQLASSYGS
jgi:alkylation response protein AidB-like acyl-CoA dehydrogenase